MVVLFMLSFSSIFGSLLTCYLGEAPLDIEREMICIRSIAGRSWDDDQSIQGPGWAEGDQTTGRHR